MKVKILVPKKNKKWKATFGNSRLQKNSIEVLYGMIERRLTRYLASSKASKTQVLVIYDQRRNNINESIKSKDAIYLLKILAQFIEDYVSKDWLKSKELKYE